jgi:hypothetical protein
MKPRAAAPLSGALLVRKGEASPTDVPPGGTILPTRPGRTVELFVVPPRRADAAPAAPPAPPAAEAVAAPQPAASSGGRSWRSPRRWMPISAAVAGAVLVALLAWPPAEPVVTAPAAEAVAAQPDAALATPIPPAVAEPESPPVTLTEDRPADGTALQTLPPPEVTPLGMVPLPPHKPRLP